MTPLAELFQALDRAEVRIWLDGDRLRHRGPAGALTARLREDLTTLKPTLIEALGRGGLVAQADASPIVPASLSYQQLRIWDFAHDPRFGAVDCALQGTLLFQGLLDADALGRALNRLRERHEALRTRFIDVGGWPLQIAMRRPPGQLPRIDLTAIPAEYRYRALKELAHADITQPFDAFRACPLRCRLVSLGTTEHVLLITVHHIACDGWSLGVLRRDLIRLYARETGVAVVLPPPVSYIDYCAQERYRVHGAELPMKRRFWETRLRCGTLEAAGSRDASPDPPAHFHRHSFVLPGGVRQSVHETAQALRISILSVLVSSLLICRARACGRSESMIAVMEANRAAPSRRDMVGVLSDYLLVGLDVTASMTLRQCLEECHRSLGHARRAALPLHYLGAEGLLVGFPRVVLNFLGNGIATHGFDAQHESELKIMPMTIEGPQQRAWCELYLVVLDSGKELRASCQFDPSLLTAEAVERFGRDFAGLLSNLTHSSAAPVMARTAEVA